jgi:hypothetical protein
MQQSPEHAGQQQQQQLSLLHAAVPSFQRACCCAATKPTAVLQQQQQVRVRVRMRLLPQALATAMPPSLLVLRNQQLLLALQLNQPLQEGKQQQQQ